MHNLKAMNSRQLNKKNRFLQNTVAADNVFFSNLPLPLLACGIETNYSQTRPRLSLPMYGCHHEVLLSIIKL